MRTSIRIVLAVVAAGTALSSCSITDAPPKETATPTAQPTQTTTPTYSSPVEEPNVRLTVTTLNGNAGQQSTHHLVCVGASAVEGTDLPDADQACDVLDREPSLLDYDSAETSEECEPVNQSNVADVFGEMNGKQVRTSYRRDNTCNVESWDKLKKLLGTITAK